jgi:hypothetical protein
VIHIDEGTSLSAMPLERHTLPTFLVVGAPKTGTTSLYYYLKKHPQIFMSPIKEPSLFCTEIRPENGTDAFKLRTAEANELRSHLREGRPGPLPAALITEWDDYELLFRNVRDERAVGEASVCYLWSVSAPGSIRSKLPHAKIIMILRDPAERAFSHYLHILASGNTKHSFRKHIDEWMRGEGRKQGRGPFLEFGCYYEQVKRYFESFQPNNVRIYWYEEAWQTPNLLLANLFEFLNVDRLDLDTSGRHRVRRGASLRYLLIKAGLGQQTAKLVPQMLRPYLKHLDFRLGSNPKLKPEDRKYLIDYYRNDIEKLAVLTNRDLTTWLT